MNQSLTRSIVHGDADNRELLASVDGSRVEDSEPGSSAVSEPVETAVRDDGGGRSKARADTSGFHYIAPSLRQLAVPIDSLRPMRGNARAHGERDLSAIADSLEEHGQLRPIVVARRYRSAENAIIAGCGTWMAAKRLGWRFIAATWFTGSDEEAASYSVRDNRTSELSSWDRGALLALQADGTDLQALWHDDLNLLQLLGTDAPVPAFEPVDATHRLDELAPVLCPHCGGDTRRRDLR